MTIMAHRGLAPLSRAVAVTATAILILGVKDARAQTAGPDLNSALSFTFLITSKDAVPVPPPPDSVAMDAERTELRKLLAARTTASADRAAYWATGGSAYRWNAITAEEMIERGIPTPIAARHMALLHAAVHDAVVSAFHHKAAYQRARPNVVDKEINTSLPTPSSPSYPSEHAAVAGVASEVLAYLFPDKAQKFRAMSEEAGRSRSIAGVAFPSDIAAGLALGHAIGAEAVKRGKTDGFDAKWTSSVPTTAGSWTGTNPILPLAGTWRTWLIASGDALRPPPPPAPDSTQKISELAELKAVQRSPAMTSHAWFWEWGAGGSRAWYFWNEETSRKVLEYGLSDKPPEAARAFALASMAVHDAVVACWDAKYAYWAMRPFQVDSELKPLFSAPNHPSYPAAHACISTAVGYTLAGLFPRDAESLRSLANQAGDARMWAGIHFRSDVEAGRAIGDAVAALAIPLGLVVPVR
jgi:membrane-associated phospholipid phosphatase